MRRLLLLLLLPLLLLLLPPPSCATYAHMPPSLLALSKNTFSSPPLLLCQCATLSLPATLYPPTRPPPTPTRTPTPVQDVGGEDRPISNALLKKVDYLCPNESELARITGVRHSRVCSRKACAPRKGASRAQAGGERGTLLTVPTKARAC